MTIPMLDAIAAVVQPVFEALPMERAMPELVLGRIGGSSHALPAGDAHAAAVTAVADAVSSDALAGRDDLAAGLWLYVDDLLRSHDACQDLDTPTGSFWHAVVHRREGDFSNAHHWVRMAGRHPAMASVDLSATADATAAPAYDPARFVDDVARAHRNDDPRNAALVRTQAEEWWALFAWCVQR